MYWALLHLANQSSLGLDSTVGLSRRKPQVEDKMFSPNRIGLFIVFPALLLTSSGCRALMNFSSSSFFSSFSLEELVKNNQSPPGVICAKGGMGGGSVGFWSVGRKQSSGDKTSGFACQLGAGSFDEAAFIASLKADVEKAIIHSGAKVMSEGSSAPGGFYFEYSEGDIHGRINIVGKIKSNYYSLEANLHENSEAKAR
jgi:hypothetical protein